MLHYYRRCKFCGRTYSYQASGYGCLEPTNDENYCPDCKAIILDALEKQVPKEKRLVSSPKKVEKFSDELLQKMSELKSKYESNKDGNLIMMARYCLLPYDNIDIFTINGDTYYITYNDENIEDKHYFVEYEYCSYTDEYKDIYHHYNDNNIDTYSKGCNIHRSLKNKEAFTVKPCKLSEPLGKLFYFDFFNVKNEREMENE